MTKFESRKKSEARTLQESSLFAPLIRHSGFVIPSDFVIRHSDLQRVTAF